MSFKEKFSNHLRAQEEAIGSKKAAQIKIENDRAEAEKQQLKFENNFTFNADSIAKPILQEFVKAAQDSGFYASFDAGKDDNGNEQLRVLFIPRAGQNFSSDKRLEAVFTLQCRGSTQKVAHVLYYDQRLGQRGKKEYEYGLESLNDEVLRRELEEFMDLALESHSEV